ncbi:MAG: SDR family NAD(P)-dependent oxidoreductase [Solirubrobacteraceae bacterium]
MLILGATSEISKAFIEECLKKGEKFENIHLITSNKKETEIFSNHLRIKHSQQTTITELDLLNENNNYDFLNNLDFDLVFCATGYLGMDVENGLYNNQNTTKIIEINYSKLVVLLNEIAHKLENKKRGTIIILSSIAGERGRKSNFIYGSAKAAITAYASGLRNYLADKGVHVMTVIPGFMNTKMTSHLSLPKPITASPEQAASSIYKSFKKKKDVVYVLWMWKYIKLIITNIPEFIFKKLSL